MARVKPADLDSPVLLPFPDRAPKGRRCAVLLTCYMTGATRGRNLGTAGYSYDFVARLFVPLLERWAAEVIPVARPEQNLERAAAAVRARNLDPVHVSFLPFQDVCLARSAPNVIVPAWEFPDVPDEPFDGNPQNDWPATANRCAMVLVGGPFTEQALRKAGTTCPIRVVPVPTPQAYFETPFWQAGQRRRLPCGGYDLPLDAAGAPTAPALRRTDPPLLKRLGKAIELNVRQTIKAFLGPTRYQSLSRFWRRQRVRLPCRRSEELEVSGVVYASVFNPSDGRKNWEDLLAGFLYALGDCEDATLVVKLITSRPDAVESFVKHCIGRQIPHRCRVVVLHDFLSDEQMVELAEASTYYLQTTRAEGNCLPLMNSMAAGRPGVSPDHSAMGDYFDDHVGFVVQSHPEPAAWPHDSRLRTRTTWGRLVWPSLVQQIRRSYQLATGDPAAYAAMAARARARMQHWASEAAVWKRLKQALDEVVTGQDASCAPAVPAAFAA